MTKAERIMASLKAGQTTPKPQWDTRQRFALALMRADSQVSCTNCKRRYRPCRVFAPCKESEFSYFLPKDSLMEMQANRVNYLIDEIKLI